MNEFIYVLYERPCLRALIFQCSINIIKYVEMKGEGLMFIPKDSWHGKGHGFQSLIDQNKGHG